MEIRIWGCRGALPTPGPETIRYGGNTTCVEVRPSDGSVIILDAGSGIRKLGKALMKEEGVRIIHLFLTHAHWDHLMGFPFFRPAYLERYKIHVRGGPRAKRSLRNYLRHQMEAPYFPVRFDAMKAEFDFTEGDPQKRMIGSAEVVPIRLNHPNGSYGIKIMEAGKSFVFFTDHELDYLHGSRLDLEGYVNFCKGADLLLHDAQYTDEEYQLTRSWGHSTFSSATDFCIKAEVRRFGLFHHDPDHTDDQIDRYVSLCQERILKANSTVDCFGVQEGIELMV
jgi:phosphoribosyl 1,2-cyclic phosphodiesterase